LRLPWQLLVGDGEQQTTQIYSIASEIIGSNFFWPAVGGLAPMQLAILDQYSPAKERPLFNYYSGAGLLAGRHAHFEMGRDAEGVLHARIANFGHFSIDAERRVAHCVCAPQLDPRLYPDFLLGPPLLLTLALNAQFCLHASVVARGDRAVAILGDSGAGKSTAARVLAKCYGWDRLADDVAAFARLGEGDELQVFGNFPQLKVSASDAWRLSPARLCAVIDLRLGKSALGAVPLTMPQVALKLAGRTMAARLFPHAVLEQHLALCAQATRSVQGFDFVYAHTPRALEALGEHIAQLL